MAYIFRDSYVTLKLVFRLIKTSPFSVYKTIKSRIYKESSLIIFQSFLFKSTVKPVLRSHLFACVLSCPTHIDYISNMAGVL